MSSLASNVESTNVGNVIRNEELLTLRAEREKYSQETKKLKEEAEYYRTKTQYLNMKMSQLNDDSE
jgi:hypothetical protein